MNKIRILLSVLQGFFIGLFFVTIKEYIIDDSLLCHILSIIFFVGALTINRILVAYDGK